jgi:hypothetical protein
MADEFDRAKEAGEHPLPSKTVYISDPGMIPVIFGIGTA